MDILEFGTWKRSRIGRGVARKKLAEGFIRQ
jgi:hypothetical protein